MRRNVKDLSLPPYITGKSLGEFHINFLELTWKRRFYNAIEVHILWWGDNLESSAVNMYVGILILI